MDHEHEPRRIVESGYARMAEGYLRSTDENDPAIISALEEFAGWVGRLSEGREMAVVS